MSVMYLLIGISIAVATAFLALFLWAVKSGQYDDTHTPAIRILFDDQEIINQNINNNKKKNGEV